MYKLIGSPKTRAARVMWCLEELGADYEIEALFPRDPKVAAVNPTGKIPVLIDGDLAVPDSVAILLHLSDKHGALTFPVGTPERARMYAVIQFAVDEIEGALWTGAKHSFVLPEDLRALEAIKPALHHDFTKAMATLEKIVGDGPFACGETFTIADIILGHLSGWAKASGFPMPEGPVADYFARVRGRDGWKAVTKAREAA